MADQNHELPNPPRRGLKKGLYLIPSLFTAANIGMGFYSVMASLRGFQPTHISIVRRWRLVGLVCLTHLTVE
jgi:ABC-type multidrug transport system permease subunit